jgi:CheY-like chemotaxis protein/HPt (histidine-containing phosphotransfer) domain-containing protein
MGGRIWFESESGQGSTFHFTAKIRLAEDFASAGPPERAGLRGVRALIVDDNATCRQTLAEMLTSWEMNVALAANAQEALNCLAAPATARAPFTLALIDADMPAIDGFELVRQIKSRLPGQPEHTVMLLTSGDRSGDVSRCDELGLSAYLMKPINQSELFDTLSEVLRCGTPDAVEAAAAAAPDDLPPLQVLLAEDSLYNQKLAVALLERKGHHVVVAANGAQAVELARTRPFDLVLMDVQMPEMDGLEATSAIREREAGSGVHLPIVAMTAQAMKGDREKCLEAGMDDYLTKPVRAAQLYETIASIVGRTRQTATVAAPAGSGEADRRAGPAGGGPDVGPTSQALANGPARAMAAALKAVDGDAALLADVARIFLSESPRLLADMEGAISQTDAPLLRRAAHTIKGGLRMFGAESAYDLASRLERLGREGDVRAAGEIFENLKQGVLELQRELSIFAAESPVSGSLNPSPSHP